MRRVTVFPLQCVGLSGGSRPEYGLLATVREHNYTRLFVCVLTGEELKYSEGSGSNAN